MEDVGSQLKCQHCGADTPLPFKCPFCGGQFCIEHRLPETHACQNFRKGLTTYKPPTMGEKFKPATPAPHRRGTRKIFSPLPHLMSPTEAVHISLGALIVALVGLSTAIDLLNPLLILPLTLIFTSAFILHEFGHKLVAGHYGLWAEFRLSLINVIITLISIFNPLVKIVSPGAVLILGMADRETFGKISLSGPLINMLLSIAFLMLFFSAAGNRFLGVAYRYGLLINAYVALFNLIPAGILDGYKVFKWNKVIWLTTFIITLALVIAAFAL